ncbi:MAG: hypothetical protein JST26_19805 [Bacteroidetes bacterium]|nr:hypothetical protein [Bacteroidota bacterium]
MEKQYLFDNEDLLVQSDDKTITLTTHRIRYSEAKGGIENLISIHLEKISSIEMKYTSKPFLIYFGILALVIGTLLGKASNQVDVIIISLIIGSILIISYFLSRKHTVVISSDGGSKIIFETKGMKSEAHIDFINKIEKAKHKLTNKYPV